jgi:hypothetical protein
MQCLSELESGIGVRNSADDHLGRDFSEDIPAGFPELYPGENLSVTA